jgi:hypothetical protein
MKISKMTLSLTTGNIIRVGRMTLSITTISIVGSVKKLSITIKRRHFA